MTISSGVNLSISAAGLCFAALLGGGCVAEPSQPEVFAALGSLSSSFGAEEASTYLQRYGYLEREKGDLEEALLLYQEIHHLPADGSLNEATRAHMARPRCGAPDTPLIARHRSGDPSASYVYGPTVWPDPGGLTYRHVNFSTDLTQLEAEAVVTTAIGKWTHANTRLGISKLTGGSGGDLLLSFEPQFHQHGGTTVDFGAALAHSGYPGTGIGGDVHFNDAFFWTPEGVGGQDLLSSALHELGHALGLDHTTVADSVMQPVHAGIHDLGADDILGIRTLYPPATPQLTNINHACFGGNSLSWTESFGAIHYELYRSSSSNFTNSVLVSSDSDTYEEVSVPPGGWYLRVKACWGPICSALSNQVRAAYYNGCM